MSHSIPSFLGVNEKSVAPRVAVHSFSFGFAGPGEEATRYFKTSYAALCKALNEAETHPDFFCSNSSNYIEVLSPTLVSVGRYACYVSKQTSERKDAHTAAIFTKIGRGIAK